MDFQHSKSGREAAGRWQLGLTSFQIGVHTMYTHTTAEYTLAPHSCQSAATLFSMKPHPQTHQRNVRISPGLLSGLSRFPLCVKLHRGLEPVAGREQLRLLPCSCAGAGEQSSGSGCEQSISSCSIFSTVLKATKSSRVHKKILQNNLPSPLEQLG